MEDDQPRYRFGPLERRGLIAGWRGGQIAVVASGLVVGVFALRRQPDALGAVVALASLASALAVACWPVAGRTGEEWLPILLRWGADGLAGHRRVAATPTLGHCVDETGQVSCLGRAPGRDRGRPAVPRTFDGLQVLGATDPGIPAGSAVGVIHDARAGTFTGVLALEGHSFALLGADEKERRVSGWAGVLAALAREGSAVHRVQWLASALPDDGRAVHAYLDQWAARAPEDPARRSYTGLLDQAGADTSRHVVLLAVQVRPGRGRARHAQGAVATLMREEGNLRRLVESADVACAVLTPDSLSAVLRAVGLSDPPTHATPKDGRRDCPPCLIGAPWPMGTQVDWSRIRTDETWHATYWIAEWPRVDVGPDFLAPLLLGPLRRTVSVVMEPVSPVRAVRAAEQARTADLADSELRRRGGFLSTARRAREAELVVRRERELADGHASYRFSGYVTVTATTPEQLEECCQATEQSAGQARLELRRLYGDQERALLCTLPLCRGLA
jgi:hypothetical protein